MRRRLLSVLALCATTVGLADEAAPVSADFAPCAACHLADGAGIPGAFPKISSRAAIMASLAGGREYLITLVSSGLMGPMTADGITYQGVMPGQQGALEPAAIAKALNFLIAELASDRNTEPLLFTADEVEARQSANSNASPMSASAMRTELLEQHGELWPQ